MHKILYTLNHQLICVEAGNKVYNHKQSNTNFIPNPFKHNNAVWITLNKSLNSFTLTRAYLQVPLFFCVCVLMSQYFHAKNCVTIGFIFVTQLFLLNHFLMCDNSVYMNFEMIEGSFVGDFHNEYILISNN